DGPKVAFVDSHTRYKGLGIETKSAVERNLESVVVHEHDVDSPLTVPPAALQTDVARDDRLPAGECARGDQRSPEHPRLAHMLDIEPVGALAIRWHRQSPAYVVFVRPRPVRWHVHTKYFLEEIVGESACIVAAVVAAKALAEVLAWSVRTEVGL